MQQYLQAFYKEFAHVVPHLIVGLLIFALMYIIAIIMKKLVQQIGRKAKRNPYLFEIFASSTKSILIVIGVIMALGTMGINVTALVTSLGLAGFALGLAIKDPLSNMIAGVMLLYYQPFDIGDVVAIDDKHTGEIMAVSLRYTRMNSQGQDVMIPNITVLNATLIVKHSV